jgi:hypothetical protein
MAATLDAPTRPVARLNLATRRSSFTALTTVPADLQGFREADEGTRTLDLLHGKPML